MTGGAAPRVLSGRVTPFGYGLTVFVELIGQFPGSLTEEMALCFSLGC